MSIEYRDDCKYRFRVRKDGINYSLNYFCNKKLTEEDIKKKNYPKEVQDAHKKFEVDVMYGNIGYNENMKFSELAQAVLDDYIKPNLRATSQACYTVAMNHHILPEFSDMKINKIKTLHIQKLINKKSLDFKPNTVSTIFRELNKTFNKAIEWGILKENPCRNVKIPKIKKTNYSELLSAEDIEKLIKGISEQKLRYKVFYSIALYAGMRVSEILSLTISDINFSENSININKQHGLILKNGKLVRSTTDTKTENSVRKIYIPDFLAGIIKEYINSLKILNKDGYIFYNVHKNNIYSHKAFTEPFAELLKEYGIPKIKFHDLRHLYATLALNSGVSVVAVARTLGDTIETVLKNYTHGIEGEQQKAAFSFEKYIKNM